MDNRYTYHTIINSHDADLNGIVRPSAVLKYMQEAANLQLSVSKPSSDDLRAAGRYFVASKISFTIHQSLYSWDEIDVSTWGCESRGATFNRCSKIERKGELCASLSSAWALLDAENGAILRVSDVTFDFWNRTGAYPRNSFEGAYTQGTAAASVWRAHSDVSGCGYEPAYEQYCLY